MQKPEYDLWFEVWVWDGFMWEFEADFDTLTEAERFTEDYDPAEYKIKRCKGQA